MSNALQSLLEKSIISVDSGDFCVLKAFKAEDVTTNPTLILAAIQMPQYEHLLLDAIDYGKSKKHLSVDEMVDEICCRVAVNFGKEALKYVPGVVSTEVDACLSFDTKALIAKARQIVKLYEEVGVPKSRILIKLASTWEGCEAAKVLEQEQIHCNMTLIFSLCQAIAAAEAKATLISPFVGRILDWYKAKYPEKDFSGKNDPGVQRVIETYKYYKHFQYKTIVMGASFRNIDEIKLLAGVDKLTISPKLLNELKSMSIDVPKQLCPEACRDLKLEKIKMDEQTFRWMLNEDQMATEKLSDGIRVFNADAKKLRALVQQYLK